MESSQTNAYLWYSGGTGSVSRCGLSRAAAAARAAATLAAATLSSGARHTGHARAPVSGASPEPVFSVWCRCVGSALLCGYGVGRLGLHKACAGVCRLMTWALGVHQPHSSSQGFIDMCVCVGACSATAACVPVRSAWHGAQGLRQPTQTSVGEPLAHASPATALLPHLQG